MSDPTPPRTAGRRGLGPALTTFLVVDVLLVLAVLVALAAFLSGGDRSPDPGDAPPAATAPAGAPAPGEEPGPTPSGGEVTAGAFALPSGNIACEIDADAATCTIADSTAEPVPVEGCAGTAGQVLTVTAQGASTPCVQGALPGPAAPGTPVLEYGETTTSGDFTCESATTGVTCRHDPSGAGFRLARAGHELLPATA